VVRESIAARVARGKLDCRVRFSARQGYSRLRSCEVVGALARLASEVQRLDGASPLSTAEILAWEGVLSSPGMDADKLRAKRSRRSRRR